jgi:hypothetical protein
LGGGVFGFPALSFGHGLEQQHGPGWDVGVVGCRSFPLVGPVLRSVGWLDAGGLEQLPNEFAAFGPVIIQVFVGPLARDEHAATGDAQVFEAVSFALAPPRDQGVSSALGLDPIQQPHRTTRRARGDLQFGMQPVGMIPLSLGDVVVKAAFGGAAVGESVVELACPPADPARCARPDGRARAGRTSGRGARWTPRCCTQDGPRIQIHYGARPVVPPLCTPRDRHVAQLLGRGAPRSGGFRPA